MDIVLSFSLDFLRLSRSRKVSKENINRDTFYIEDLFFSFSTRKRNSSIFELFTTTTTRAKGRNYLFIDINLGHQ